MNYKHYTGVDHYDDISKHKVVDWCAYPRDTKDRH